MELRHGWDERPTHENLDTIFQDRDLGPQAVTKTGGERL